MKILLLQVDGKLPNLALMRIAAHHRELGDAVELRQVRKDERLHRELWDDWERVYASAIFTKSQPIMRRVLELWPNATCGGSGWNLKRLSDCGITTSEKDYSLWPGFKASIGFTQRGCRLECGFCSVPIREGKVKPDESIAAIYRGDPHPKHLLLLDNDFFGEKEWQKRIEEIKAGDFKVCFSQGVNARLLPDEGAAALASIKCRDDSFKDRRIYTAWDNTDDEKVLFRGLERLVKYGFRPDDIMVYVLIGWGADTEAKRLYRRDRLREFGARPYPMPYDRTRPELMGFQRWVVRRLDMMVSWEDFKAANYRPEKCNTLAKGNQ